MSVTINYKYKSTKNNSSNLVLFTDEKFNIFALKKLISSNEYSFISDLIKTKDIKKKIISFDVSSKRKIILVSVIKNINIANLENLGAKFYDLFKDLKQNEFNLISDSAPNKIKNFIGYFYMV